MLSLVRSIKNSFAPINRIPQEVLSLIPDYCNAGEELVTLTHVCRGWREQFISRSSLWTFLDCASVDRTNVYLKRSKTSPLEIRFEEEEGTSFSSDALLLTVPYLSRLKSLYLSGSSDDLFQFTKYFTSPAPLLKELKLNFTCTETPTIEDVIFNGNLPSLRKLRLSGITANLAWEDLSNLRTFDLRQVPGNKISVTQLLDLFERTPRLRNIQLWNAFPSSSDAPPGRVVSLPRLKSLTINAQPAHPVLLDHLSIPAGASLSQRFTFSDDKSPIPTYLPKTLDNLKNISHIASINLSFDTGMYLRLAGSGGGLYMFGGWCGAGTSPPTVDPQVLRSLSLFNISTVERLKITFYNTPQQTETAGPPPVYTTLLLMNGLRNLTLTHCHNSPFVSALNPKHNASGTVVCPKLEKIVLHITDRRQFYMNELLEMAKERASGGAKLSTVTIVGSQRCGPEALELRDYVSHVEYVLHDVEPEWDVIPADNADYASDR